ncbi:MAG: hypothetical protein ACRDDZ_05935 [Marinifilaceae bacterium]
MKKKGQPHWSASQESFVRDNIGKMTISQMAEALKRSKMSVRLFIHRKKLSVPNNTRNVLLEILTAKFVDAECFAPTKTFYEKVGINQKRWWELYRGEVQITDEEYLSLCNYFNVTIKDVVTMKQLTLF